MWGLIICVARPPSKVWLESWLGVWGYGLWNLCVASMRFKLKFHMISNMLVAHSMLFGLLLLDAVWRAERSSSERRSAAPRQVATTMAFLPAGMSFPCHASSCSALPATPAPPPIYIPLWLDRHAAGWFLQRLHCRHGTRTSGSCTSTSSRNMWASAPLFWALRRAWLDGSGALVWCHLTVASCC
jgi:hypothetical protein